MENTPKIPLSAVLGQIAREIKKAHNAANKDDAKNAVMSFQELELEFGFEIEYEAEAGASFWVLNLGGKVNKSETNTLKIKYKALPGIVASVESEPGKAQPIDKTAAEDA